MTPISVSEKTGVVIRNSSLRLRDLDTPNDLLVFMVTKAPVHGETYYCNNAEERTIDLYTVP